ncbi:MULTISPECIES: nitrile hydratase accessory protein [unclassified Paenibacillus]|uniref:nitrile hydratase accessory protein n=1 Tax=unclassified Paenibacillus TaxID=185978 RepID=UPI001AE8F4AF|nr:MULTISPECIES: nitrile hydratase accessory protein [unclassified Paenibacillus]MBP1154084.1 nitrile hydratase accessory protein [Paenibacillus sp. PvP091]MBP1170531.1 nitrile hydratase accessory protein [Paenibacillus sp. PvR098]MBP2441559.1 nitrile hydratase accessory protein [Paenibacillus sp. PvP052]
MEAPSYISGMEGKSALPRKNGELVFQEPWEGKIFAMAVALDKKGLYVWNDFRDKLAEEITKAEKNDPNHETEKYYYEHWQTALEKLLIEKKIVSEDQLKQLLHELKNCKDHDHDHDHNHDHDHHH